MVSRFDTDTRLAQTFLELEEAYKADDLELADVLKSDINALLLEYPFEERPLKFLYFFLHNLIFGNNHSLNFLKYLITQEQVDPYAVLNYQWREDGDLHITQPYILMVYLCQTFKDKKVFKEVFSFFKANPNEVMGGNSLLFHAVSKANLATTKGLLALGANPYILYQDVAVQHSRIKKLPQNIKQTLVVHRLVWLKKFMILVYKHLQTLNPYTDNSLFGFRLRACNSDLKLLLQKIIVKFIKKINHSLQSYNNYGIISDKAPLQFEKMIIGILNSYLADLTKRESVRYKDGLLTFLNSIDKKFFENFIPTQQISLPMFRSLMSSLAEFIQNENQYNEVAEEKGSLSLQNN